MTPQSEVTHRHPGVTFLDLKAELQREAAYRARVYPGRVEKAAMSEAEAAREQALIAALIEDVDRILASWCTPAAARKNPARPELVEGARHTFTWHERRAALHRELGYRRRFYPGWIERGRLTPAEATRQIARLEALLEIFDDGWDWTATNGIRPHFAITPASRPDFDARGEWYAHCAAVSTARDEPNFAAGFAQLARDHGAEPPITEQKEMAL